MASPSPHCHGLKSSHSARSFPASRRSVTRFLSEDLPDNGIGAESPIRSISQDRLRRADFAERIAVVLSELSLREGRVFAIRGGWGFGKRGPVKAPRAAHRLSGDAGERHLTESRPRLRDFACAGRCRTPAPPRLSLRVLRQGLSRPSVPGIRCRGVALVQVSVFRTGNRRRRRLSARLPGATGGLSPRTGSGCLRGP